MTATNSPCALELRAATAWAGLSLVATPVTSAWQARVAGRLAIGRRRRRGRPRSLLELGNLGDEARHLCLTRPQLLNGLRIFVDDLLLARLELFDALLHRCEATRHGRNNSVCSADAITAAMRRLRPRWSRRCCLHDTASAAASERRTVPAARQTPASPVATRNRHRRRRRDDGFRRFTIGRLRYAT